MSPERQLHDLLRLRALIVILALVCLCVSSHVGLQLFPLPSKASALLLDKNEDHGARALRIRQHNVSGFRVPIMAQSQKRADQDPPQSNPFISESVATPVATTNIRIRIGPGYTASRLMSITATPNVGRAPPLRT